MENGSEEPAFFIFAHDRWIRRRQNTWKVVTTEETTPYYNGYEHEVEYSDAGRVAAAG